MLLAAKTTKVDSLSRKQFDQPRQRCETGRCLLRPALPHLAAIADRRDSTLLTLGSSSVPRKRYIGLGGQRVPHPDVPTGSSSPTADR